MWFSWYALLVWIALVMDLSELMIPVSGKYTRYNVVVDTSDGLYTGKFSQREKCYVAVCIDGQYYLKIPSIALSGILLVADEGSRQLCD